MNINENDINKENEEKNNNIEIIENNEDINELLEIEEK